MGQCLNALCDYNNNGKCDKHSESACCCKDLYWELVREIKNGRGMDKIMAMERVLLK